MSDSLQSHGLQHAIIPCPSLTPRACSNSCPLSWPSNHLLLCHSLLLLPSVFPSIRVFSNESVLSIMWPKYWSFSFSISPSIFQSIFRVDFPCDWLVWFPCSPRDSQEFSSTTVGKHQFFSIQPPLWSKSHTHTWLWKNQSFDCVNLCWQSNVSAF